MRLFIIGGGIFFDRFRPRISICVCNKRELLLFLF